MSTTNILDLNNRIDALEKAVRGGDSAQANKKDIATEFNTTTAYTEGCFVYYKGKLYQFNADHAAGAWDPTDVVEANVTDQIVSNKAAIDAVRALSLSIGIPQHLCEIGVKREDIPALAVAAFNDVCTGGNPRPTSVEDIAKLYEIAFE